MEHRFVGLRAYTVKRMQDMRIGSLASTPTGFFVSGIVHRSTDMDPGPGVDPVLGGGDGNPFISEYAF